MIRPAERISDTDLAAWQRWYGDTPRSLRVDNVVTGMRCGMLADALQELQDWRSGKLRLPTVPPVDREAERRLLARQHAAQAFGGEVEGE